MGTLVLLHVTCASSMRAGLWDAGGEGLGLEVAEHLIFIIYCCLIKKITQLSG